jgi:type II secretory pathway component PulF
VAISLNRKTSRLAEKIPSAARFDWAKWLGSIRRFGRRVKAAELIFFASQLSLMLEIGTPLSKALAALAQQTENEVFREIILALQQEIEEGRQLSDAMRQHPLVFNNVIISMVQAGESGGFLKDILDRIVEMQEKRLAVTTQIKTALTYPAFLCVIGFLVIVFVMVGVLPKFTAFFAGKESILPFHTRFLMAMSGSMRAYWWIYILLCTGLAVSLKLFKESKQGQTFIDWLLVRAPLIARLSNKIYTCELLRILGHLMESQVPLLDALTVTRGTVRNQNFRRFVDRIKEHVKQGGKFSKTFADYPYILPSVREMVATGEEAGNLSRVMLRLAKFYDEEVERDLKKLGSMIEPMALIVLGVVVGLIVSAVILPMFKLAHALR